MRFNIEPFACLLVPSFGKDVIIVGVRHIGIQIERIVNFLLSGCNL